MTEKKRFLRGGHYYSLIQNNESTGFPLISRVAGLDLLFASNHVARCRSKFQDGKDDFQKQLIDARKVIFNKEDLANWLYKIKEEARTETDLVFIKAKASYLNNDQIDFERVGYMAGFYEEAERLLKIMTALEPLDKDKAHYTIIDRLEEIDNHILQKDIIPGYYQTQANIKIKMHEFDIQNLDKQWKEQLTLADIHPVCDGFGDSAYLLRDYHSEFVLKLVRIEPLVKIRDFLDYHLKNFKIGNEIDFLNHIQFRIIPRLDTIAGSNYLIYKQLINEWLKEKIFNLSNEEEHFLIESIVSSLKGFLEDIVENRKRNDENKFNMVMKLALNHRVSARKWQVFDQSLGGETDSISLKSKAGVAFRDLIVNDQNGRTLSALECFRLKNNPKSHNPSRNISLHVKKIFRNEPLGISPLCIVIYCETGNLGEAWEKYLKCVRDIEFDKYHRISLEINKDFGEYANIKIARALHNREMNTISVYHFMVNLYP